MLLPLKNVDCLRSQLMLVYFVKKQPLYGYLREKLQVATRVYFDEKDFSRTGILEVRCQTSVTSVLPP